MKLSRSALQRLLEGGNIISPDGRDIGFRKLGGELELEMML